MGWGEEGQGHLLKTSLRPTTLASLLALLGLGACVDGRDPTGLDLRGNVSLALAPSFAVEPSRAEVGRLTTARIVATDAPSGEVLVSVEQAIDPEKSEWFFDLVFQLRSARSYQVVVTVELVSDIVEWSGRGAPVTLAIGAEPVELKSITMLRGPLDNLDVTGVEVLDVPEALPEGVGGSANSSIQGGGAGAVVFFRTLTPEVLEVARDGTFRAIGPGTGLLEARAGAAADTAAIAVQVVPVEDGEIVAVSGGIDDSSSRLVPSLQDAAGAQAIATSLGAFEEALGSKRAARILDAITAAREALASYGDEATRYQDGPGLSLIGLVLDYTERVVLGGITASSRGN